MKDFKRLINLLNTLQNIYKLVKKFEKKWKKVLCEYQQFTIHYYDKYTSKKIYHEFYYNPSLNIFEINFFEDETIKTEVLRDTKNYILFDLGKKDFVMSSGKDLKSSIFVKKETEILLNIVRNVTTKIIVLDDIYINNKMQQILSYKNSNILDIKPLYVNYYIDLINNITDKFILAKTIVNTNNASLNNMNLYSDRYLPLFGYYITFSIYDDFCKNLSEQISNDLTKLKAEIFTTLLKYKIVNNCNFLNFYVHKELTDRNNCYINFEVDFDFRNFLDIILLADTFSIIQKL